jgi:hypothetical protein
VQPDAGIRIDFQGGAAVLLRHQLPARPFLEGAEKRLDSRGVGGGAGKVAEPDLPVVSGARTLDAPEGAFLTYEKGREKNGGENGDK